MITEKMLHNANKFAFLVKAYPKHTLGQLIKLFQASAIDINTAIMAATELGFIGEPDKKTGMAKLAKPPAIWDFGKEQMDLQDAIVYGFSRLALKETDLEESFLLGNNFLSGDETTPSGWLAGYPAHDVLIAIKALESDHRLAQYDIEDTLTAKGKNGEPNIYTFFTLYVNRDKKWGLKQFKKDPLKGKKK